MEVEFLFSADLVEDYLTVIEQNGSSAATILSIFEPTLEFLVGTLTVRTELKSEDVMSVSKGSLIKAKKRRAIIQAVKNAKSQCLNGFADPVQEAEIVDAFHEMAVAGSGKKVFLCEMCSYKASSRGAVKKHVWVTHNANCPRYLCSLCPSKIKEKGNMKVHYMKVHQMSNGMASLAVAESRTSTDGT